MGAGCYYTNCFGELAYWIINPNKAENNDYDEFENERWNDFVEDLGEIMIDLGYFKESAYEFSNGLLKIELKSTYYGDGLVIQIEPKANEWEKEYNLARANMDRCEKRIIRNMVKAGYEVRYATSGYTSAKVEI